MALERRYQNALMALIKRVVPGCTVYLFGSRARDQEVIGSDIDIALDASKPIDDRVLLALQMAMDESTIPMKVDVVDLQVVNKSLREEILREGIKWNT